MPNYSVIFDIAQQSDPAPVGPLLFISAIAGLLGAIAVHLWFQRSLSSQGQSLRFVVTGVVVGLVCIAVAMWVTKTSHEQLIRTVREGNVHVAEGVVEKFHPMPPTGHDTERFTVAGQWFAYSDYVITGGFNNTVSHGGPIKEGLAVRLTYVRAHNRTIIVKVEIARGI